MFAKQPAKLLIFAVNHNIIKKKIINNTKNEYICTSKMSEDHGWCLCPHPLLCKPLQLL